MYYDHLRKQKVYQSHLRKSRWMSKNPTTPTTKFPIIDVKNEDHSGTTTKMTRSHWLKCCTIRFRKKILAQEQSFFPVFTLPLQDGCKEITSIICYFIVIDHFKSL